MKSIQERFDAKWQIGPRPPRRPDLGPCHIWTASTKPDTGYGEINFEGRKRLAHRVAWMLHTGESLTREQEIDHLCGVHACVNILHLRKVTSSENKQNRTVGQSNSTSGIRGVSWSPRLNRWRAHVTHQRKFIHVGYFTDKVEAGEAARLKRLELMTHNDLDRI